MGDDTMARLLFEKLQPVCDLQNLGERMQIPKDLYVIGGGTLIAPGSLFLNRLQSPTKSVGFSLGVAYSWNGEYASVLRDMKAIYVRDEFSHRRLAEFGVKSVLSVDLLNAIPAHECEPRDRTRVFWNSVKVHSNERPPDAEELPVSVEDNGAPPMLYGKDVVDLLTGARRVYVTRLHAAVAAWMAGVPEILVYPQYDPKVGHFFERVRSLTPIEAHHIVNDHLNELTEYAEGKRA